MPCIRLVPVSTRRGVCLGLSRVSARWKRSAMHWVSEARMTTSPVSPGSGERERWLVRFGRLGYLAKGLVYIVVGFLATQAAVGSGGETTDIKGALQTIGDAPFGRTA